MPSRKLATALTAAVALFFMPLALSTFAFGQQENLLYSFNDNGQDGYFPYAGLVFDSAGNLYGTTFEGGAYNYGAVFEFSPKAGGGWTESVLHSFGNGQDGQWPKASLILDSAGNLYGTTYVGGASGLGTVFELSPATGGGWTETVLHSFAGGRDGTQPKGGVVLDSAGNLYGTTYFGGTYNGGTAFELERQQDGTWQSIVLHNFGNGQGDGQYPAGSLIFDAHGNVYGTTGYGGNGNGGTVFELTPIRGKWQETILFNFNVEFGIALESSLIFDSAGNLYGTATQGGPYGYGTLFELTPSSGGTWTISLLHFFGKNVGDGKGPLGIVFNSAGIIYGITGGGGIYNFKAGGDGTVYEMKPEAGDVWSEAVLHNFGSRGDGITLQGAPVLDAAGDIYGTTTYGGANGYNGYYGYGTLFEIVPPR